MTVVSLALEDHVLFFCDSFCLNKCFSATVGTKHCCFGRKFGETGFGKFKC